MPFRVIKEVFPMNPRDRQEYLESLTPDARAWFYERELKALGEIKLRQKEQAEALIVKAANWISLGCIGAGTEEVYYRYRHAPCGTELEVLQGCCGARICPECDPENYAAMRKREEELYGKTK